MPASSPRSQPTVLVVFGTRPEALKMAPVVTALRKLGSLRVQVVVTGQHLELLAQGLDVFGIVPDVDLGIMRAGQDLTSITTAILAGMRTLFAASRPNLVLVHGDTTTSLAAALAAFYADVAVAHVEAGLRTGNRKAPWPEEMNRVLTARLACLHFAPTATARDNLLAEGVAPATIEVTGNTIVDSLMFMRARIEADLPLQSRLGERYSFLSPQRRLVLLTAHRRESLGAGLENICDAARRLAAWGDVDILYPVHPNPRVREPVHRLLAGVPGVHLVEPLDYLELVYVMSRSFFVMTDSGGMQEEAPGLGKPVLVLREATERPEAIEAGTACLVGTDAQHIVEVARRLLDDPAAHAAMAQATNPFGDGRASERIATQVNEWLQS